MAHIAKDPAGQPYIRDDWGIEDIFCQAENDGIKLTKKQAINVMDSIVENFDANIGINWEVISDAIHTVLSW